MMVDFMKVVQEGGQSTDQRLEEDATSLDRFKRVCLYLMRRLCGPEGCNLIDECVCCLKEQVMMMGVNVTNAQTWIVPLPSTDQGKCITGPSNITRGRQHITFSELIRTQELENNNPTPPYGVSHPVHPDTNQPTWRQANQQFRVEQSSKTTTQNL